jgi:predicted O-methyltransferase YrrM
MPLLPYSATTFLAPRVGAQSRVFEYGGGGSTVWFARRAGSVITIEHDEHWSEMIEHRLASLQVRNVSVRLIPPDVSTHSEKFRSIYDEGSFENYVKAIDDFPDASFDVVMVDGRARIACLERSIGKVRPGGVLVLDDSSRDRYQEAGSMLRSWQKHEFQGVRPTSVWTGTTSCWIRPI